MVSKNVVEQKTTKKSYFLTKETVKLKRLVVSDPGSD